MWKPGVEDAREAAEPLDHVGVLLGHHHRRLGDDAEHEERQHDENEERTGLRIMTCLPLLR